MIPLPSCDQVKMQRALIKMQGWKVGWKKEKWSYSGMLMQKKFFLSAGGSRNLSSNSIIQMQEER